MCENPPTSWLQGTNLHIRVPANERATHCHLHTFRIAFNLPSSIHKSVCESIVKAPQSQPRNFPDFNDNSEML